MKAQMPATIRSRLAWETTQRRFYGEFLPTIIGREFSAPRSYGHAKYRILGGHGAWKEETETQKVYFHYEGGEVVLTGNQVHFQKTLCVAVKRLGGYDGSPKGDSLQAILSGFSPEVST